MLNKLTFIAVLTALATSGFCQAMTGNMTWVSGTLVDSVPVETTPQTIMLQVGDVQDTLPDTYLTGLPGTILAAGTPMEFMDRGSTPYHAGFSQSLNMIVFNPADGKGLAYRRTVPMSNVGALSYSIATVGGQPGGELVFYVPPASDYWLYQGIATDDSITGLVLTFGAEITSYSLTLPTTSAFSSSTVTFPNSAGTMNTVNFNCAGNVQMTFQGASTAGSVPVIGNITFSPGFDNMHMDISGANLTFTSG